MAILKAAGCSVQESGAGCCGMAGSFGYEVEHYDVSRKIGEERLFPKVNDVSAQTIVSVAGVSCHQQIEHFTERKTQHIAEVLASRIELEYGLPVRFSPTQFTSARWVAGDKLAVEAFVAANKQHMAEDNDGDVVYLTRLQWDIDRVVRDNPEIRLTATKEMMA